MDQLTSHPLTRREALGRIGTGFGMVGLASLISQSGLAESRPISSSLAIRPPHMEAKAKRVIFLFLNGGLSQVDTFDPKPALDKYHGQPFPGGNLTTERKTGSLMRSPFTFKKHGQSGIEVSEIFENVGRCIDDICLVRSVQTDVPNHEPSLFMMNCGHIQPGRPSLGSWLVYGLGTENQNLPGYVVLCPGIPTVGTLLWNSMFLPTVFQGTYINNKETDPRKLIAYLRNEQLDRTQQRKQLDLLFQLNQMQLEQLQEKDAQLEGRIQSMEVAFRMQTEAAEVFDIGKESLAVRERYGDGDFARGCLTALRLVERGVRIVQVYFGSGQPWDNHEDILIHRKLAAQSDRPMAALLQDLKARGLLDETLVICGSEFGRTPVVETGGGSNIQNGRDHNPFGFTVWLAGGGIKGGMTYGATDEFGFRAVENPVQVHDLHATILHLLGLDHERLTYHYSGRDFRLTDVSGRVIREILA
ncbi:MAG: DUF1501 domain-containing protein [Acidobacteria bacterium]|nr:DUF1501 domain-containing protein [Acidobacteriota bacterium]MCI0721944.1 DUF1501 domain-containing protein [Acidobacteriota bacterium]